MKEGQGGVIMVWNLNGFCFRSPHPLPLPQGEREFPDGNYLTGRDRSATAQRRRSTFYETINYVFEKANQGAKAKKILIYDYGHIRIMTSPHF
jgi:hypothetical protein